MKNLKDAKRKFVFEITPDDVTNAERHNKNSCVIACAVRETPGVVGVEIGATMSRITTDKGTFRYTTPKKLKDALTSFDATGKWNLPVGVYKLSPPAPHDQLTTIHKRNEDHPQRHDKPYPQKTKRNTLRHLNPRVIEFAKMRNKKKAAA